MAKTKYQTAPVPSKKMPKGIPYIIGNEGAERFSFYGMRGILVIFMTQYLMGSEGQLGVMSEEESKKYFHLFVAAVYFTPFLGALLSDLFLGKYRTIILLSTVYCLGHVALALDDSRVGLAIGLGLIALGSGGIKPCVSAHVGDQFGKTNQSLLAKVFGIFYFAINLGAFISTLLTPWLLDQYGPHVAFAVPGVLMFLATLAFWMGRRKFIHIPPSGWKFVKETFSKQGLLTVAKLASIYVFVAMFWSIFDQTGSAWVLQAEQMDRNWLGHEWLSSQIQAANPLLVMILIPVFTYVVYPLMNKFFRVTPLRKISIGFFVTVLACLISTWIQSQIDAGETPNIKWQVLAYVILTSAEVMVSITCLEFSYTQAPRTMKSFIMSVFFLSITLGNLFTAQVNNVIQNEDGSSKLAGADYYWFFTVAMLVTAVLFIGAACLYKEKTYIQNEQESIPA